MPGDDRAHCLYLDAVAPGQRILERTGLVAGDQLDLLGGGQAYLPLADASGKVRRQTG